MVATATHSISLAESLNALRATRARTLAMAEALLQVQLDFVPGLNRWSIGEVLDHILLGERLNREQIAKLVQLKERAKAGADFEFFRP